MWDSNTCFFPSFFIKLFGKVNRFSDKIVFIENKECAVEE